MRDNIRLPPLAVSGLPESGRTHNPFGESTVLPKLGARALGQWVKFLSCLVQLRYGTHAFTPFHDPTFRVTVNFPFGHQSGSGFAFSPFRVIREPSNEIPFRVALLHSLFDSSIRPLPHFNTSPTPLLLR